MNHIHTHNMEWWLNKNIHAHCFELFGHIKAGHGQLECVMQPIVMKALTPEESQDMACIDAPTLRLTQESCQNLMDQLWSQGIRPSNGDGNVGQLAATQKHLEDMRSITFDLMKMTK